LKFVYDKLNYCLSRKCS